MELKIKNIFDKKLKKDYQIIIPGEIIERKIKDSVEKVRKNFTLKGFRKGLVPVEIIKEKYGQSIMSEEVDKIVSETIKKIISDNKIKLALSPKVDFKTIELGKDVDLTVSFEIFPEVPEIEFKKIKVTRRTVETSQSDFDDALKKLLKFYCKWDKQDSSYKAKIGDAVNIDYLGRIDKKEFEGGAAKSFQLELGTKSFIDDFEDQLVGKKAGSNVVVKVKFPKEYHNPEFSGKSAEFDVTINEVLVAKMPETNDEFIKNNFGLENKSKLEEALRKQVEENYSNLSRSLFKKELFDFLNKKYDFDLPTGMVEEQLKIIWSETEEELKTNPNKFKNEKEKEKAKEAKRETAERMVRCGIIISEISQKNKIEVTNEDLNKELGKILARFPKQEKAVLEFYQKNQNALQNLKGTVIEDKVVDLFLQSSEEKKISVKDFEKLLQKAKEEN